MFLTDEQQAILAGSKGDVMAKVMKTLVMYGETFGADKLVPVTSTYNHLVTSFGLKMMGPVFDLMQQLIDAGADCIDFPAPGSRGGITVEMIRELVQYVHSYKPGTLAMSFLNSSVEGADPDTIREVAVLMKQTGADIYCIGDGGFAGCSSPENVHQLSVSVKGRPYTYFRMASVNK